MPKALCILGMTVGILVLLIFLLDLAIGIPFGRASALLDAVFGVCGGILAFLSWTTLKEQP
jgi:hypothetical protein